VHQVTLKPYSRKWFRALPPISSQNSAKEWFGIRASERWEEHHAHARPKSPRVVIDRSALLTTNGEASQASAKESDFTQARVTLPAVGFVSAKKVADKSKLSEQVPLSYPQPRQSVSSPCPWPVRVRGQSMAVNSPCREQSMAVNSPWP